MMIPGRLPTGRVNVALRNRMGRGDFSMITNTDIKHQILAASLAIVPAARACIYGVTANLDPCDHVTADGDTRWTQLYHERFRAIDPFHPRHFVDRHESVYGTNGGGGPADERRAYVSGFRQRMGMAYKVEVFMRNGSGRIVGGMRLSRTVQMGDFRHREVAALRALQPVLSGAWQSTLRETSIGESSALLTAREDDILQRILEGMPDKLICRELGLALPTVKSHVRNILRKTGTSGRAEVIARYLRTARMRSCQ
jgi:DNA-binding CsgD family transcriptional regulator